jgi:hypothetical protein
MKEEKEGKYRKVQQSGDVSQPNWDRRNHRNAPTKGKIKYIVRGTQVYSSGLPIEKLHKDVDLSTPGIVV